jgi:L-glyceraldehyde 3-phosphate reductase
MTYVAAPDRYDQIGYRRCGRSGLKLPEISLGLWQNFGSNRPLDLQRAIVLRAFDLGHAFRPREQEPGTGSHTG